MLEKTAAGVGKEPGMTSGLWLRWCKRLYGYIYLLNK
jgi:hypothetical protein